MKPSFDLTCRPWIPCLTQDGDTQEMSILEVLSDAHRLQEIADASPLVTVALYRLLLAILHRVFGPPTLDDWERLWEFRSLRSRPCGRVSQCVATSF